MSRAIGLALLALAGCATALPVSAPLAPPAASGPFAGVHGDGIAVALPPSDWWRLFDDPALNRHVERALAANADLRVALANLDVARASERLARASRLPHLGIESGAGETRAVNQPSTTTVPTTDYDLGATVAYEVDLFGRLRSAAGASRADVEASAAALDAARVVIAADTVAAYVDLCGALAGARIAGDMVAAQRRSAELIAHQFREGEVSPLELSQARASLAEVEAIPPTFEADRKRALFRLATLQGKPPAEADQAEVGCSAPPKVAAEIPVGDGAALIARRPDIREAERRIAAATARIGVAIADLYPRISLGGSAGLTSGGFDGFVTPLVSWAISDRNAARARIAATQGTAASALAQWDGVMLRALREVESALADYQAERARRGALLAALSETEQTLKRARARHRLGADSYVLVLDAERTRNDTARQLASSELRIAQTQVSLFRALGGGWEQPPSARSAARS